jgi:hypothetical protein
MAHQTIMQSTIMQSQTSNTNSIKHYGPGKDMRSVNDVVFCGYWVRYHKTCGAFTFKLRKCTDFITAFRQRKKITLRELQSLIGLLNFACSVIIPGRAFLRRFIDLTHGICLSHHFIKLNRESKEDLNVWLTFLANYNGRSFFIDERWANRPSPFEWNFDLDKTGQKFHHSLKEHHKISNIPKFRCKML